VTELGWNVDTLKEYMDAQFLAQRDALNAVVLSQQQQFRAQEAAISVASTSTALALTEAKVGPQKQYDVLTAKMDELVSRAGGSVPRGEMEALLTAVGSRAETQISDAVSSMTSRFSADITRLTTAVENQSKMWGNEFGVLNAKVAALDESLTAQRSRIVGATLTGKTLVTAVGAVLTIVLIISTAYNFWPK
jgi:hypothetical protein